MAYLVTRAWRAAGDHLAWTVVMGPEGNRGTPATGPEHRDPLDSLGQSDQRVRKENLDTSQTTSQVCQVFRAQKDNLVSEVLTGRWVIPVHRGRKDFLVPPAPPAPRDKWEAEATEQKERKETRATWVFPGPAVLRATGR